MYRICEDMPRKATYRQMETPLPYCLLPLSLLYAFIHHAAAGGIPASGGTASLGGHDVGKEPEAIHRLMGYCPQFDALFETLTGREHLRLYAAIKVRYRPGLGVSSWAELTGSPPGRPRNDFAFSSARALVLCVPVLLASRKEHFVTVEVAMPCLDFVA